MSAYYNEHDPAAAEWLRNLIAAGLLPAGDVDERDIRDVRAGDLRGYRQVHLFAGIGGWPLACRLADIADDFPIWTGSCPCQPFSVAGRRRGVSDERHLWPHFFRLIRASRPVVVVGEQVAGAAGYGWFDGVRSDLESEAYACRAVDIPACGVGAPHIRSRLYWCGVRVADAESIGRTGRHASEVQGCGQPERAAIEPQRRDGRSMGHADRAGLAERGGERGDARAEREAAERADGGSVDNPDAARRLQPQGCITDIWRRLGDANPWRDAEWIICHDGKARRTKPGVSLLVNGVSGRVAVSRTGIAGESALQDPQARHVSRTAAWQGFGNAIVPVLAAEVLRALMEVL